jgi:PAS domain S-box-containing protein
LGDVTEILQAARLIILLDTEPLQLAEPDCSRIADRTIALPPIGSIRASLCAKRRLPMDRTIRILHLERDEREAQVLASAMAGRGLSFQVDRVTDERAFRRALGERRYDLVVSEDCAGPFDAFDALAEVRTITPGSPFIVVAGNNDRGRAVEATLRGASAYVVKNDLDLLGSIVAKTLQADSTGLPMLNQPRPGTTAEATLRALMDACPLELCLMSADGCILLANKAFAQALGRPAEELPTASIGAVLPPERSELVQRLCAEAVRTGEVVRFDENWSGRCRESTISPVFEEEAEATKVVFSSMELSARRRAEEQFSGERDLMRVLMDHLPDYIYLKDTQNRYILSNLSHLRVLRAKCAEEIAGKTDFDFFPAEVAARFYATEEHVMRTGEAIVNAEEEILDASGHRRLLLTTRLPVRDPQGKILGTFAISRDVTEEKRINQALKEAQEDLERKVRGRTADLVQANAELRREIADRKRVEGVLRAFNKKYQTLFEGSKDVVFISSPEGKFLDINPAGVELYAYDSKEELLKIDLTKDLYVYPMERQRFQEELTRCGFVKDYEMLLKRKDGQQLVVLETAIAVRDDNGKVIAYQGFTRNITDRKRAEEELRKAHTELERRVRERTAEIEEANKALQLEIAERRRAEQELRASRQRLRHFAARLQDVREEEKKKIAREIHDELGQVLTGLKIDLSWLTKKLSTSDKRPAPQARAGTSTAEIRKKLESMSGLLDSTMEIVRRISRELRPSVLEHLGLLGTLEWQAHEFETRTGIACTVSADMQEVGLKGQDEALAVFRIFQEALTNVARHAQATEVRVGLTQANGHLVLNIADNGKGIQDVETASHMSVGLLGMRERAILLGGNLMIESAQGKGTALTLRIPVGSGSQ